MVKKNFLVLMSGGTTPVINSTLVGIITELKKKNIQVFSGKPGIEGVEKNKFVNLSKISKSKLSELKYIPGSHFIGTTRIKKLNYKEIKKIEKNLISKNIKNIINIGGNGTLKQTIHLSNKLKNFNFASCPKTVDNDLGDKDFKKVQYNPGFPSCILIWKFFYDMLNLENIGAHSHDKVIISQTFGRDTGFICGSIRLWDTKRTKPIMLLLPEDKQPINRIIGHVKKKLKKFDRLLIFISEGYKIGNIGSRHDKSGQVMYGSSNNTNCQLLSNILNKEKIQSRIFNPTILQRVFKFEDKKKFLKDNKIAYKLGSITVQMMLSGKKSFLISIANNKIVPINYISCNNFARKMPIKFIKKGLFDVNDNYIKYLKKINK